MDRIRCGRFCGPTEAAVEAFCLLSRPAACVRTSPSASRSDVELDPGFLHGKNAISSEARMRHLPGEFDRLGLVERNSPKLMSLACGYIKRI